MTTRRNDGGFRSAAVRRTAAGAAFAKLNLPFCFALVLLCLTLISMHLTGGLFARYAAVSEFGDSARIAKFEITSSFLGEGFVLANKQAFEASPGENIVYGAQVTNNSEVAVSCMLVATSETGNLPIDSESDSALVLAPGSDGFVYVTVWWDAVDSQKYMGMVDLVNLELKVEQID